MSKSKSTRKIKSIAIALVVTIFGSVVAVFITYASDVKIIEIQSHIDAAPLTVPIIEFTVANFGQKPSEILNFYYIRVASVNNSCNVNTTFFNLSKPMCNLRIKNEEEVFCTRRLLPLSSDIAYKTIEYTLDEENRNFFSNFNMTNCNLIEQIRICAREASKIDDKCLDQNITVRII